MPAIQVGPSEGRLIELRWFDAQLDALRCYADHLRTASACSTVMPRSCCHSARMAQKSRRETGSTPVVGSSKIASSGS